MGEKKELIIFETADNAIKLEVPVEGETVWLNRQQMAELFNRDVKTIGKHINNALREELDNEVVVAKFATTTPHGAIEGKTQTHMTDFHNLDVIISVGYRVNNPLRSKSYIPALRKRLLTYYILLPKTIAF